MKPFVCALNGYTFLIHFKKDHELHIFSSKHKEDKDNPELNWQEKHPIGTSFPQESES